MDKEKAAAEIIAHALPIVPFEGWTQATLGKAALAAGYKRTDAIRVFPGGAPQAVEIYFQLANRHMLDALSRYSLPTMKVRERVTLAVRLWLEGQENHKEALRKAIALQAMPFHSHQALQSLYGAVDEIWHALGDSSTDFNFYTKRLTLGAVLSATTLYWLEDKSAGHEATWAFLDRRIEDVMKIEKAKGKLREWLARAPEHLRRKA